MPKIASANVHLISLGCPKNLIDSEIMVAILQKEGFRITQQPDNADTIIINTCAFILPAKEESIEEILRMATWKKQGRCRLLVVTGCLPQRYGKILCKELPEVDLFLGTSEIQNIALHINNHDSARLTSQKIIIEKPTFLMNAKLPRQISTPFYSAYLKIAEGCSNRCSYCVIPEIRGEYRSRDMKDILQEAETLADHGVREIIITAQDTTAYGKDLHKKYSLAELLKELAALKKIRWLRLLYAYPTGITKDLLKTMADEDKICKYIDLPIQHMDDRILQAMHRRGTGKELHELFTQIRSSVPHVALRTSIIVGFPGETKMVFNKLQSFIKAVRFDHLGVFTYSREEGTGAYTFPSRISQKEKELRRQSLMEEQAIISYEINRTLLGSIQEVLVEGKNDDPAFTFVGRCRRQTPDIDGITYIRAKNLKPGDFVTCRIMDAGEYDLYAEMTKSC